MSCLNHIFPYFFSIKALSLVFLSAISGQYSYRIQLQIRLSNIDTYPIQLQIHLSNIDTEFNSRAMSEFEIPYRNIYIHSVLDIFLILHQCRTNPLTLVSSISIQLEVWWITAHSLLLYIVLKAISIVINDNQ